MAKKKQQKRLNLPQRKMGIYVAAEYLSKKGRHVAKISVETPYGYEDIIPEDSWPDSWTRLDRWNKNKKYYSSLDKIFSRSYSMGQYLGMK